MTAALWIGQQLPSDAVQKIFGVPSLAQVNEEMVKSCAYGVCAPSDNYCGVHYLACSPSPGQPPVIQN